MNAEYFIRKLNLVPHKEGGYYKELPISEEKDAAGRPLWSSIYFLLGKEDVSHLHRLKHEEVWYYHSGGTLSIYMFDESGKMAVRKLGLNAEKGESPQITVPAGTWFGSCVLEGSYCLAGCMVAPAFTFDEFELSDGEEILKKHPEYRYIINRLTGKNA